MAAKSPQPKPIAGRRNSPASLALEGSMSASVNLESSVNVSRSANANAVTAPIRGRTEITRFRVFARVRPFIEEERAQMKDSALQSVVEMMDTRTILLDPKENYAPYREFNFDRSFWSIPKTQKLTTTFADNKRATHDSQLDVYNAVAKGCVDDAFDGFNSCIMTYGQTSSGKTHTMMGIYNPTAIAAGEEGDEGIIPRVCNDLFAALERGRKAQEDVPEADRVAFKVEVTFVEIYMEKVRDLLDPRLKAGAKDAVMSEARVRQDPNSGPFVEGVTKYEVETWAQCCQLLERGSKQRTTCATIVHQQSSRSHAIFQLTVMQTQMVPSKDRYSAPQARVKAARINLVDLAGSERGGFTEYVKESAQINKSLLALRRVIDALVERQNAMMEMAKAELMGAAPDAKYHLPQVPFRDSVLTWLLSDSIGGNARTTMVATLSPLEKNFGDTLATLTWSSKARNLVTVVRQNDTQSAISSKNSELASNLAMRQQTVDGLRATLADLLSEAEKAKKDAKVLDRRRAGEQEKLDVALRERAARVMEQACMRWLARVRARIARKNYKDALDRLAQAERERDAAAAALAAAEADEAQRRAELAALEAEGAAVQAFIDDFNSKRGELDARRARAEEAAAAVKAQVAGDGDECRREIADAEDAIARAAVEVAAGRERADGANTEAEGIEAEAASLEAECSDGEALAKWNDAHAAKTRDLQAELDRLRALRAELEAKRSAAQNTLELVRRDHRKIYPEKYEKK